ncbi:MAG: phosphoribosylformylglycinamidine synthase [Coriobacteriia bacterium]|nr:phosphoribosylformylglycinamidine synthase [Coriobacteriia bacterium]
MIYRVYVEKKPEFAHEADALKAELGLKSVRVINRYDVENVDKKLFDYAVKYVFSEPQVDNVYFDLDEPNSFAVEYLPGQFDQRADSAAQCIQIISQGEKPKVSSAKVYVVDGDIDALKKYVINPVDSREASLDVPETLEVDYEIKTEVETLDGFCELSNLQEFIDEHGLAMDLGDIQFCQKYFRDTEHRDPTITEIKMIDTYWSDHCRHTTFSTIIDNVEFEDELIQETYEDYLSVRKELGRTKPVCLMDLATIAVKYLKPDKLDESEEINACTVKMKVNDEDWLLLFKNETHNHPTEIEPFGGAATCIGGAIRDPLSGRSYVYGAMRVTGAGDPRDEDALPGKLSQKKIVRTAADGYSSYGNQIGLATGIVDEIYHPGYVAKRMEIGAVIGAAPACNVRRERPEPGDIVIYLGGSTGRDGIGGATGSSKAHNAKSVETCGAEVQKGNAPEERKLQRFFRNPGVSRMIKRCNDFGAGGVSVAIGELADGLNIDLNAVPKKYEGLDGTELAISESQERMAVVVEAENVDEFLELADKENLQACVVAKVTESPRLVMNWNGKKIVDISREFLNSNGAEKHIDIVTGKAEMLKKEISGSFKEKMLYVASSLNCCSKRGLSERFDSTIGAGTVLMPFGGKNQLTPIQAMVNKVSIERGHTDDCSLMAFGYNPYVSENSPYHGAYLAVVESVCKLIATGAKFEDVYLTFQEYFEGLDRVPERWGKPLSALLGAYRAQKELGIAAIGGKDSMSGSFEDIHVPPTLVSFAVTTENVDEIISPEFKAAEHKLVWLRPEYGEDGLPTAESLIKLFDKVRALKPLACYTPGMGGLAEAIMKMSFGNGVGVKLETEDIFDYAYGSFLLEVEDADSNVIGETIEEPRINDINLNELLEAYESPLEDIFPTKTLQTQIRQIAKKSPKQIRQKAKIGTKPKVVIPVFPGNNCEYDTARAFEDAGAKVETFVINNLSSEGISRSIENFAKLVKDSQMIFIPGGFSAGDEPDGSGKFITAFFRNAQVKDAVTDLLDNRGGLMGGICNGFQALVKLGLVPFGKIIDTDETCPTLTHNTIARHQSKIVRTRIADNSSPWLSQLNIGDIINVAISHGEGRFICEDPDKLNVATQYVDLDGNPTMDIQVNPNGSIAAIEGITSPDGRVFGKMGHAERMCSGLYKNVPGNYDYKMFESAVKFFN